MLLELQQPDKALVEFEAVLRGAPNRFNALYGAAKAADRAGDRKRAQSLFAKLIEIAPEGERAELSEARAYSAR
jgi:tetratricopeptide (TPR) repeat protein